MNMEREPEVLLSVIIPAYNVETYLKECLDSVLDQDLRSYEIICVNDGSTDNTGKILDEYARANKQVRVFHKENGGLPSARNYGMPKARGKYIYFLDSDDYLSDRQALSFMVDRMEAENLDLLHFDTQLFFESEELEERRHEDIAWFHRYREYGLRQHGYDMFTDMVRGWDLVVNVWLSCVRRDFLEKHNITFLPVYGCEDEFYTFRTLLLAGRVRHVSKVLHNYRIQAGSIMSGKPSFKAFYGGVVSWLAMLRHLDEYEYPLYVEDTIITFLRRRTKDLCELYSKLEDEEKAKIDALNGEEQESIRIFLRYRKVMERLENAYKFPYHLFPRGASVVIYGAGKVGEEFYRQAVHSEYIRLEAIVDKKAGELDKPQIPVKPVSELRRMAFDYILIAVLDKEVAEAIKEDLTGMGISKGIIKWDGKSYQTEDFYRNFYFPHVDSLHNVMRPRISI